MLALSLENQREEEKSKSWVVATSTSRSRLKRPTYHNMERLFATAQEKRIGNLLEIIRMEKR